MFNHSPTRMLFALLGSLFLAAMPNAWGSETSIVERWQTIEGDWEDQYEGYFNRDLVEGTPEFAEMSAMLARASQETQQTTAILYVIPRDEALELILATPSGQAIQQIVPEANHDRLLQKVREFEEELVSPRRRRSRRYLDISKQLYDWIIAPLAAELEAEGIETLVFCFGPGLRTFPVAALHDGDRFLVESYSLAHIPGYHLLNTELRSLRNARVLAMGASQFENSAQLPGVPLELSAIVPRLWPGQAFLNEEFTLENLQQQREQNAYEIIHLATHASFHPGAPSESYIQLWQDKLPLDGIDDLDWSNPQVQLLVLSACSTARGSEEAELGFAGLAVQSGIPSVVASLWPVSDTGTLVMMAEFYQQLQTAPTRAEALRRTQVAALRGQLRLDLPPTNGQLPVGTLVFSQLPENAENLDLSHPYYWAAFTTVGNPW